MDTVLNAHVSSLLQNNETAANPAESTQTTGRLKKIQNLVQVKREHLSGAGRGKNTCENNGVLLWVMLFNLSDKLLYWFL